MTPAVTAVPKTALLFAAGLGTRMRPLTLDRPKALVEVAGRTLIDRGLDHLKAAGVERVVINLHAFADRLQSHLIRRGDLTLVLSDEREHLLETGGGLRRARPLLGDGPVLVANVDSLFDGDPEAIIRLAAAYDPAVCDVALMVTETQNALGFDEPGDFFMTDQGRLRFRGESASAPWSYVGLHICAPNYADEGPEGPFSLSRLWRQSAARGRLIGSPFSGTWMHVGDPAARDQAEARLRERQG